MQNYRNNAMPYNNYRQPQPSCMIHPRTDDTCMTNRDMYGDKSLAMAYVPWQTWREIYETEKGFHCGTIFKELNLPFLGKGGAKR